MPSLDPLAKLRALTKSESGPDPFEHESESEILNKLLGIFTQIPAGKELVDKANQYGTRLKLLKTTRDFSFSPETNTVFLGIPASSSAPKARMLLHLAMGLEEAAQEQEGLQRLPLTAPFDQLNALHIEKQRKIMFAMCKTAYQLINFLGLREILDELQKMGHIDLYEAYEQDVQTAS